jgi:hypothetical protein
VSNTVIKRLIRERILPAHQVVACAPWIIERSSLELATVHARIDAVHRGRRLPRTAPEQAELPLKMAVL